MTDCSPLGGGVKRSGIERAVAGFVLAAICPSKGSPESSTFQTLWSVADGIWISSPEAGGSLNVESPHGAQKRMHMLASNSTEKLFRHK